MTGEAFVAEWSVPLQHPVFDGHFPGNPIVPGVWLLDEALARVREWAGWGVQASRVDNAKFFQPVRPGSSLKLELQRKASGAVAFRWLLGEAVVASGQFSRSPASAASVST